MYFLTRTNTKKFCSIPEWKYFAPLRILHLFIEYFIIHFLDIAFTFSDSSFNSFSTKTWFVLFEVIFLCKFLSLSARSLFFMKLTISFLLA